MRSIKNIVLLDCLCSFSRRYPLSNLILGTKAVHGGVCEARFKACLFKATGVQRHASSAGYASSARLRVCPILVRNLVQVIILGEPYSYIYIYVYPLW